MSVHVPYDQLSPEALQGVLENFVLREGTDYGEVEWTFGQKVAQLRAALENGKARIMFDPETESVTIVQVP